MCKMFQLARLLLLRVVVVLADQGLGEVWPKPKEEKKSDKFMAIKKDSFNFKITSSHIHGDCDILDAAILRYPARIFPPNLTQAFEEDNLGNLVNVEDDPNFIGWLDEVEITMNNETGCKEKYPYLNMNEYYEVKINSPDEPKRGMIIADSVWGILRGMETFSQMVYASHNYGDTLQYFVTGTQIRDSPRFSHRGVLLDTSRHYIAKSVLLHNLDLMEMSKFNVFHWHITDDPSFPFVSKTFPNLSLAGSFNSKDAVYTPEDVAEIVEYARLRGIRVLSEFDTPAHTTSWHGHPDLLTECYEGDKPNGMLGPIDPTKDQVYDFLQKFFQEVVTVFPDKFLHLGGDEVFFGCWESNPMITDFMAKNNITGDYSKLLSVYFQKLQDIVSSYPTKNGYIVWHEVFDNNVVLKNDTVIHVWSGDWESEMHKVTSRKLPAILSSPWYLDLEGSPWSMYYNVEPLAFNGSVEQNKLVLGGEVCMWSHTVNSTNLLPCTWPRACAVAEKLWSSEDVRDEEDAKRRIQEMESRLLQRGYPVQPSNGPDLCNIDVTHNWNL